MAEAGTRAGTSYETLPSTSAADDCPTGKIHEEDGGNLEDFLIMEGIVEVVHFDTDAEDNEEEIHFNADEEEIIQEIDFESNEEEIIQEIDFDADCDEKRIKMSKVMPITGWWRRQNQNSRKIQFQKEETSSIFRMFSNK